MKKIVETVKWLIDLALILTLLTMLIATKAINSLGKLGTNSVVPPMPKKPRPKERPKGQGNRGPG